MQVDRVSPCAGPGAVWTLTPRDPLWPEPWRTIDTPPVRVRGAGDPAALSTPAIAVVGTRRPSPRGRAVALADFHQLLETCPVDSAVKARLKKLAVADYTGLAARVCREALAAAEKELGE